MDVALLESNNSPVIMSTVNDAFKYNTNSADTSGRHLPPHKQTNLNTKKAAINSVS